MVCSWYGHFPNADAHQEVDPPMRPEISQETAEAVRKAADRAVQGVDTDELSFEQQVRAILRAQERQTRAGSADLFQ